MKLLAQGIQKLELELKKKNEIRCRDLDLGPIILKLNCGFQILKRYLQTENAVARFKRYSLK